MEEVSGCEQFRPHEPPAEGRPRVHPRSAVGICMRCQTPLQTPARQPSDVRAVQGAASLWLTMQPVRLIDLSDYSTLGSFSIEHVQPSERRRLQVWIERGPCQGLLDHCGHFVESLHHVPVRELENAAAPGFERVPLRFAGRSGNRSSVPSRERLNANDGRRTHRALHQTGCELVALPAQHCRSLTRRRTCMPRTLLALMSVRA